MTPTERSCFIAGLICAGGAEVLRLVLMALLRDSSVALAILPR